jgi:hypothetical protein
MFPGDTVDDVLAQLIKAAADPSLTIAPIGEISPTPTPPPLTPLVYGTAKTIAQKHFPGVPLLPAMSTGATDGRFLNAAGIPTYGVPGRFSDPDGNGVHGLNGASWTTRPGGGGCATSWSRAARRKVILVHAASRSISSYSAQVCE